MSHCFQSSSLRCPMAAFAVLSLSALAADAQAVVPNNAPEASVGANRPLLVQSKPEPVEKPVSYTNDQAKRGEKRYKKDCLECHGKDLKGGLNGGAPLRGVAFEEKYADGAPASAMFLYMSELMPPNAPGRYSETTYAELMAYILKKNGFKKGAPLPSDLDALDYLIVEK